MLVPFEALPPNARLWIYQASRPLSETECQQIETAAETFIESWDAHGAPLQAAYGIPFQHFLIIGVNQGYNLPSGCSIDKSVELVRQLEQTLGIPFFERTQIAFWINERIQTYPLAQLKSLVAEGILSADTLVFDNTIQTKEALETAWRKPMKESWAKRYLPKTAQTAS